MISPFDPFWCSHFKTAMSVAPQGATSQQRLWPRGKPQGSRVGVLVTSPWNTMTVDCRMECNWDMGYIYIYTYVFMYILYIYVCVYDLHIYIANLICSWICLFCMLWKIRYQTLYGLCSFSLLKGHIRNLLPHFGLGIQRARIVLDDFGQDLWRFCGIVLMVICHFVRLIQNWELDCFDRKNVLGWCW